MENRTATSWPDQALGPVNSVLPQDRKKQRRVLLAWHAPVARPSPARSCSISTRDLHLNPRHLYPPPSSTLSHARLYPSVHALHTTPLQTPDTAICYKSGTHDKNTNTNKWHCWHFSFGLIYDFIVMVRRRTQSKCCPCSEHKKKDNL